MNFEPIRTAQAQAVLDQSQAQHHEPNSGWNMGLGPMNNKLSIAAKLPVVGSSFTVAEFVNKDKGSYLDGRRQPWSREPQTVTKAARRLPRNLTLTDIANNPNEDVLNEIKPQLVPTEGEPLQTGAVPNEGNPPTIGDTKPQDVYEAKYGPHQWVTKGDGDASEQMFQEKTGWSYTNVPKGPPGQLSQIRQVVKHAGYNETQHYERNRYDVQKTKPAYRELKELNSRDEVIKRQMGNQFMDGQQMTTRKMDNKEAYQLSIEPRKGYNVDVHGPGGFFAQGGEQQFGRAEQNSRIVESSFYAKRGKVSKGPPRMIAAANGAVTAKWPATAGVGTGQVKYFPDPNARDSIYPYRLTNVFERKQGKPQPDGYCLPAARMVQYGDDLPGPNEQSGQFLTNADFKRTEEFFEIKGPTGTRAPLGDNIYGKARKIRSKVSQGSNSLVYEKRSPNHTMHDKRITVNDDVATGLYGTGAATLNSKGGRPFYSAQHVSLETGPRTRNVRVIRT